MNKFVLVGFSALALVGMAAQAEARAGRAIVRIIGEGAAYDAMKYGARSMAAPQPHHQYYGAPTRQMRRSPFDMRAR